MPNGKPNILILWGAVVQHGFPGQGWLTYRQAAALGGNVEGNFACRAPEGTCAPTSLIDAAATGPQGLPVGLQLIGQRYDDYRALAIGAWVHERLLEANETDIGASDMWPRG